MSSAPVLEKKIDLVLTGFSHNRAELLCMALRRVEPDRFSFRILDGPLDKLDVNQLEDAVLVAAGEAYGTGESLLKAALNLRARCFWGPLHLCMRTVPGGINLGQEWAIYCHSLPPDVRALVSSLCQATALDVSRREEIVIAALASLADDLSSFTRALDPSKTVMPERIRVSIQNASRELAAFEGESFKRLTRELDKQASLPSVEIASIRELTPLVVEAEVRIRETGEAPKLLSALHTLNNVLRLASSRPDSTAEVVDRIGSRLHVLEERTLAALPEWINKAGAELSENLPPLIKSAVESGASATLVSELTNLTSKLHSLVTLAVKSSWPSETGDSIERIVVIEDDVEWRGRIVEVLKGMLGGEAIEIQEAGNITEAQLLLNVNTPSLVLVDLGLPADDPSRIIPDAGLSLIKQFTGSDAQEKRSQHAFIILTATENYTEAVHDALSFGISPANYLQKNPATWESALRAQVRLALQPSSARPPKIEVFKRTGRLARVEGLEVKLDQPLWCLLAVLAQSRRGRWHEPAKLADVLYWNYYLNPESRSPETDALDPKERILLQLPHYSSDLRLRLAEAYSRAVHKPLPADTLRFEEELGYCLNANAMILDRVDEHFRMGHRPSVLVVEDNEEWGREILQELERRGFKPQLARWVKEACDLIESDAPDLISLDIELPMTYEEWLEGETDAGHSLELLRFLRQNGLRTPIAILTAVPWRDDVMLAMLRGGVRIDDYLSKHSDQPVLRLIGTLARLWQESLTETRILDWDPLTPLYPIKIDSQGLLLSISGYPIKPSGKGKDILKALSETPNVFVSRSELLDVVYGDLDALDDGPDDPDKALNHHIKRLRKMITDATGGTIRGDHVICGERGIYWLRGVVQ